MATNGHGGPRQNSGRKRTREVFESPIRAAEKRIADRLPSLIDNLLVLADGVKMQKLTDEGEAIVYTEKPDRAANEYLINRLMGKPTDKTEADVNVTGGVTIYLPERRLETKS